MVTCILLFVVISLIAIFGGSFVSKAAPDCSGLEIGGFVVLAIGIVGLVVAGCLTVSAVKSSKDAEFLNSEYGTHYTTEQMFWNGSEIKGMVIGNRTRLQIEK
jgi:hypothetical protein